MIILQINHETDSLEILVKFMRQKVNSIKLRLKIFYHAQYFQRKSQTFWLKKGSQLLLSEIVDQ